MQRYINNLQDRFGNAVPNAPILVTIGGAAAALFSDNGVTSMTNPLTTDANGQFSFYAADGVYTLDPIGVSTAPPIRDVQLFDVGTKDFLEDLVEAAASSAAQAQESATQATAAIGRSILYPVGEAATVLPAAAIRAGKVLAFDGAGAAVPVIPVAQSATALAAQLLTDAGASQIGYRRTGGVYRTIADKADDLVSVKDFGAAIAPQAAPALVPGGAYSLATRLLGDFFSLGPVSQTGLGYADVKDLLTFEPIESRLRSALRAGYNDLFVLLQSDSTGNEDTEFFRLMANQLAKMFPGYIFRYRQWDHAGNAWGAPQSISTGGTRVITFYNGGHPGANFTYWQGNRFVKAYDGQAFDLIISNYGLNAGSDWRTQAERLAEYVHAVRQQQPRAELLHVIQPTDYDLLERSANRADAQRWVCEQMGVQVIDIFSVAQELVARSGVTPSSAGATQWYLDALHPSPALSARWAAVALREVLWHRASSAVGVHRRALESTAIPNGGFTDFADGSGAAPTFWDAGSGGTAFRDTSFVDSGANAVRITGAGSTSTLSIPFDPILDRYKHAGDIWVAARIRPSGPSGKAGTMYFAHSVSTAYTEMQSRSGPPSETDGAFVWTFMLIPASFFMGKADTRLGFFGGESGEFATIDRVVVGNGPLLADTDKTCSWAYVYDKADSAFTAPPNSTSPRGFSSGMPAVKPGVRIGVSVRAVSGAMPIGLIVDAFSDGAGIVRLQFHNPSGTAINVPAYTARIRVEV